MMIAVAVGTMALSAAPASAQPQSRPREPRQPSAPSPGRSISPYVTAGGLFSVQPDTGSDGPYLNRGVGGTPAGVSVGFGVDWLTNRMTFGVELSTTAAMERMQEGRFVGTRALTRHRDTLLSVLPGMRWRVGAAHLDAKFGASFVFGEPRHGGEPVPSAGNEVGVTFGCDAVLPVTTRVAIVPSVRYTYVGRDLGLYVGLGDHITRAGVGLRVNLGE